MTENQYMSLENELKKNIGFAISKYENEIQIKKHRLLKLGLISS